MNNVRKNIWSLFYFILVIGVFFMGFTSYLTWKNTEKYFEEQQTHMVKLVSNAINSQLVNHEILLNIIGDEFLRAYTPGQQIKIPIIFNKMIQFNPAISALGLTTPEGDFIYASSKVNMSSLPNLKTQPESKDSFIRALKMKDRLVLGRTYFFKPLNDWVIPARKAITNSQGEVIALASAALSLKATSDLFNNQMHIGDFNQIRMIRDFDGYTQYISGDDLDMKEIYSYPAPKEIFNEAISKIRDKYHVEMNKIKESGDIYSIFIAPAHSNGIFQAVLRYNKRYELWIASGVPKTLIVKTFLTKATINSIVFATFMALLAILFYFIATSEKKKMDALIFQAKHDNLTNLPNRHYLLQHINEWVHPNAKPFSLFYIDMDNFKNVNDSFGHQFGDKLLKELSGRLMEFAGELCLVVRHGGDEFLILTYETNDNFLTENARKLVRLLSAPYIIDNISFIIGASVGIAKYPEHGEDMDTMLIAADIAMYESKINSDSVMLYAEHMKKKYLLKVSVEQELRKAIGRDEIYMVYQPQVDIDGRVTGVEALTRWENPHLGCVNPSLFIDVAESTGQMAELGGFIVSTALKEISEVHKLTKLEFILSINISVSQIMQKNFYEDLMEELLKCKLSNTSVKLEITESLFIEDINYILPVLKKLHDKGICVSLDDFGTGYSSLSVLRMLPIDELKIDKSFVDDITTDESSLKMIKNIIDIGINLNMNVIAEGVETSEQMDLLYKYGCSKFQGFLFSKPLRKSDLINYLNENENTGKLH